MKKTSKYLKNTLIMLAILVITFGISVIAQNVFNTHSLIPALFVLAVFIISLSTEGYIYGITASLLSVLSVNFAFMFPYAKFNFTIPENLISTIIMIIVTILTGTLTTKIKYHEIIKAESEKERMRANLLRAVPHDLRTPLTTIYGASSAILDNYNKLSEEQKKRMLAGIRDDSEWLTRMVENLLSVTRLDGGNMKIIKSLVAVDELLDSVLHKFRKRYPDTKVYVDISEEFIFVPMDAMLIEQVIINILENSVQHAIGMTCINIKITLNGNNAVFLIYDDGCGIPQERLKDIFTAYFAAGNAPADTKLNSGIGLSVCATIIKAHGGEIWAENMQQGGASFHFYLSTEDDYE